MPDPKHDDNQSLALLRACTHGRLSEVNALLASNVDPNSRNGLCFINAAERGYLDILEALLKKGLNLDEYGTRAITAASRHGQGDVVTFLVERKGVNIHADNHFVTNALSHLPPESPEKEYIEREDARQHAAFEMLENGRKLLLHGADHPEIPSDVYREIIKEDMLSPATQDRVAAHALDRNTVGGHSTPQRFLTEVLYQYQTPRRDAGKSFTDQEKARRQDRERERSSDISLSCRM